MTRRVLSSELREAVDEAKRFLARVEALERALASGVPGTYPVGSASVRRGSMDLTRSLARMRQRGITT
jgi:inhibitor of KinA sporulation pathway (predicted exonuclease)